MSIAVLEIECVTAAHLWETSPYGVVSLLEMLRLYADMFIKTFWGLSEIEGKWHRSDGKIPIPQALAAAIVNLDVLCQHHGLTHTAQKCARVRQECQTVGMSYRDGVTALKEIRERLEDELHSRLFLQVPQESVKAYIDPLEGWKEVTARFHKTRTDIEDSSKCFALEMYSASVFHVLLVAEFGVIEVAKLLNAEGDKPGWSALDRLERIHKKSYQDKTPLEKEYTALLGNVFPLAIAMKDAWRHKISHVENKLSWLETDFSRRTAEEIISAARGFMVRLATGMPKASS